MKKILALVLVMAVSAMAVTFTGVDNGDGTVTISYDAPIVGLALDVDSAAVSVTGVTLPTFFDVFMDYAYAQGGSYVYKSGDSIAAQDAAGVATLPSSSFCISAGGLEDDELDTVPATGEITLAVTGTGTITISANTLRGGVVDYNGAMTTNLPIDIVVAAPSGCACYGDITADGINYGQDEKISLADMNYLMMLLGSAGAPYEITADSSNQCADVTADGINAGQDGKISLADMNYLMMLLGSAGAPYEVSCN